MGDDLRTRLLDAAYDCLARVGVTKTTLDDVAREAGSSRATLYRHFGSKADLLDALVDREIERLSVALHAATADASGLAATCTALMVTGAEFVLDHAPLSAVLAIEPALILPTLSLGGADHLLRRAADLVAPVLAPHTATDGDARRLAELLVRVTLSHLQSPDPLHPITDPSVAGRIVDQYIVPGFVPTAGRTSA